jgi:ribosome-associated translation inhibitor RaiA
MKIQINIPDGLRAAVESYLAELNEALQLTPVGRAAITDEIARLETVERELAGEIERLKIEAVDNDSAAVTLNTKETRIIQVNARLEELRATLAGLKPVSVGGALPVIGDVARHYLSVLPDVIADELMPVCSTREKALFLSKNSDAWRAAISLRNRAEMTAASPMPATPESVAWVRGILNRALRGQPHLGINAS